MDDELKGEGNSYDFGARMLDPRVGRWFAPDPLEEKGPEYSTYNYTFNCPINLTDPDGRWPDLPSWNSIKKSTTAYIKAQYSKTISDAPKAYEKSGLKHAVDWFKNNTLVIGLEVKGSIGAQVGIKTPFGSAEAGAITVDFGKAGVNYTKGKKMEVYAKQGDGKGHYFAGVDVKLLDKKLGAGAKVDWVNDTALPNGNGNGSNGNTDLLKASSYNGKLEWEANLGPGTRGLGFSDVKVGEISTPSVKYKGVISNKDDCSGCEEIKFGVKAILGAEVKLKVGVKD
jgi:RHS repeat-associated protein